ncbi:hypothetical protein VTP01DRAFT_2063 [Rhizomucor pusillus]|uniref:uncharacterized protein n=1 Tax=Rhizomucor pusillus TaxID=4840 RepID=UPI0037433E71
MSSPDTSVWFDGPVAEAISLVNARNCLFIAYIYDDSDKCQTLSKTLENEKVRSALKSTTVALRMHTSSDNAKMFQQVYPTYHVPILYIMKQGTIKDFVVHDATPETIVEKIEALNSSTGEEHNVTNPTPPPPTSSSSSQPISQPSSSTTLASASAGLTSEPPTTTASTSAVLQDDEAAKKEKLKKQMEQARQKREEQEKQQVKERELKRRQEGKEMQKTREELENRQNKLYFEKLKKEKKEEEEHRKRIREQIARDRAEQLAARQAEQKRRERNNSVLSSERGGKRSSSASSHDFSNLSIRQLDGSTMRNQFDATATLGNVKEWVDQNRTDGDQPYKLLAQFPTRQFSIMDEQRTLRELELCPSATLIMKSIKNVSDAYAGSRSSSGGWMDYVYSAGGLAYGALSAVGSTASGLLYAMFPAEPASSSAASPSPGAFPASSSSSDSRTNGYTLGGGSSSSGRSNVNTLRRSEFDDDNDDRQLYNGNSLNQE